MTVLRLRPARSEEEWERVAARFPERTRFHSWTFLHEEAAVGGWRLVPLVAERDGRAVAVVPVTIEKGLLRRTPSVPHPYHGPLVEPEDLPDLLRALQRERRRRLMARLSVSFPPSAAGDRGAALRAAGWTVAVDRTYVLDLAPAADAAREGQEVMPFVTGKRRARLRRAIRLGVEVRRVDRVDDLLLQAMVQAHAAHGGRAKAPRGLLDWVNRAIERGDAVAVEAVHQGERVGVLVGLGSGSTMLGWLGAALPAGRPVDAGTILYHEVLRLAALQGVERYDLLGHVDDGVAHFKRSMGAVEQEFVEGSDSSPVLATLRRLRDLRRTRRDVRAPQRAQLAAATPVGAL